MTNKKWWHLWYWQWVVSSSIVFIRPPHITLSTILVDFSLKSLSLMVLQIDVKCNYSLSYFHQCYHNEASTFLQFVCTIPSNIIIGCCVWYIKRWKMNSDLQNLEWIMSKECPPQQVKMIQQWGCRDGWAPKMRSSSKRRSCSFIDGSKQ